MENILEPALLQAIESFNDAPPESLFQKGYLQALLDLYSLTLDANLSKQRTLN